MFGGKSLLAVTVIENIEHKCLHEGCEKLFPLNNFKNHLESCPHRRVHCPASDDLCNEELELSNLYSHITLKCKGSLNHTKTVGVNNGKFPKTMTYGIGNREQSVHGFALDRNGDAYFYLCVEHLPTYTVFSVQYFGNAKECQKYVVTLGVHHPDDQGMDGVNVHRWSSEPLPIDMNQVDKLQNGLLVGRKQLEKIVVKTEDGAFRVRLTMDISVDFL